MLNAVDGLRRSDVRKGGSSDDVTDGVYAVDACFVVLVNLDLIALDGDAELLKTHILDVRLDADSREHDVRLESLLTLLTLDNNVALAILTNSNRLNSCRCHDRCTELAEGALHSLRCILILEGHDLWHILHDGNLNAHSSVDVGELRADSARAYNDHSLGELGEYESLLRRDDVLAVDGHEGHDAGTCTCCEDDVVSLVVYALNLYGVLRLEAAEACDDVDVVLLQEELNALIHGCCHHALALHHLCPVGLYLTLDAHTICRCSLAVGIYLCRAYECLCGDATPVEAYATSICLLDDSNVLATLCRTNSRYITARA